MKKIACLILVLLLAVGLVPFTALAAPETVAIVATDSAGTALPTQTVRAGNRLVFDVYFCLPGDTSPLKPSIELKTSTDLATFPFAMEQSSYFAKDSFHFDMRCRGDAAQNYYTIIFKINYTDNGTDYVADVPVIVLVTQGGGETPANIPKITISSYTTSPSPVVAGEDITLSVTFKNNGGQTAKNIKAQLTSDGTFSPVSGSSSMYISSIAGGGTSSQSMKLKVKADVAPGSYNVTFNFTYDVDGLKEPLTDTEVVAIPVLQVPKIQVAPIQAYPTEVYVGQELNIMTTLSNTGKSKLYNVSVKLTEANGMFGETEQYIGNIEPGATGNIDVYMPALMMGDARITITITYENEEGEKSTYTEDYAIMVMEKGPVDPMPFPGEETNGNRFPWWIISLAVLVIGGVVTFLVLRKKKKAAAAKKRDDEQIAQLEREYAENGNGNAQPQYGTTTPAAPVAPAGNEFSTTQMEPVDAYPLADFNRTSAADPYARPSYQPVPPQSPNRTEELPKNDISFEDPKQ